MPTPEEIKEDFAIKAVEWIKSPEGRKAIEESLRKTREAQEQLEKAHRVDKRRFCNKGCRMDYYENHCV